MDIQKTSFFSLNQTSFGNHHKKAEKAPSPSNNEERINPATQEALSNYEATLGKAQVGLQNKPQHLSLKDFLSKTAVSNDGEPFNGKITIKPFNNGREIIIKYEDGQANFDNKNYKVSEEGLKSPIAFVIKSAKVESKDGKESGKIYFGDDEASLRYEDGILKHIEDGTGISADFYPNATLQTIEEENGVQTLRRIDDHGKIKTLAVKDDVYIDHVTGERRPTVTKLH